MDRRMQVHFTETVGVSYRCSNGLKVWVCINQSLSVSHFLSHASLNIAHLFFLSLA